ncbi:hypothetical protein Tco_1055515 [Tanacetum coccineum]|uniref:Uncharacterized protein n=1 Tax=Tanacetum coccineum TaxID=301880 RepID=A0ABQ5H283_9ASTR
MSLEGSDDLVLLDAEPAGPVLEAGSLPKFDMHVHKSSLTETQVKCLARCYGIPEDLHPRVVLEGMTMNALPSDALGLYAHHFQHRRLKLRLPWPGDITILVLPTLFHKSNEYNASNVTKLREVVISLHNPPPSLLYVAGLSNVWKHVGHAFYLKDSKGKVLSMAEFLRLPNFKGCKITAGVLLPPGTARVTHLSNPADTLEAIPPKTADMVVVEIPCRKVLDDKEKKRKKAEEKAAVNSPAADIQAEKVGIDKDAGEDGPRKKRKVRARPQVQSVSEHVSSPTPLNRVKPLETLANEECVSPPASSKRMGGHGDNEGGLSGLKTQPTPICHSGQHLETVEKLVCDKVIPDEEASYSAGCFGNLRFTPQWGLTDSSRMDNSHECRDMMSNLFTPAYHEFFNEGALTEEHVDLVYAYESCKDVKARYKDCQKELAKVQAAYDRKVSDYDQLSKNYEGALVREKRAQERLEELEEDKRKGEKEHYAIEAGRGKMVRQRIINQYLPTFVRWLHLSAEYKRSLGRVFSLAMGKGFIDGISIGRKDVDIQAILKATPNMDPTSSDVFIGEYEKLFDQRYLYVDKVARMYLLDHIGLQNVMPDETGPTLGGGPCDTPTPSYA